MNTFHLKSKNSINAFPLIAAVLILLGLTANIPVLKPVRANAQAKADSQSLANKDFKAAYSASADKMPVDLIAAIGSASNVNNYQNVIVQFEGKLSSKHTALIDNSGGKVLAKLEGANALVASMPLENIEKLASNPHVVFITPDREMQASLDSVNVLMGTDQLRSNFRSSYGITLPAVDGSGIGIAVIDSGINAPNQDDFRASNNKSRIVHFKDWAGSSDGTLKTVQYDDYGHGTPVAGIIAGNGDNSKKRDSAGVKLYPGNYGEFTGIAPNANIISLRVIKRNGSGNISAAISAIDYAISVKTRYNIKIINMSLGGPVLQSYKTDPLCLAAKRAVDAGILVVASAGNYGHNDVVVGTNAQGKSIYQTVYGSIASPGNSPFVLTVGAAKDPNETILKWHQDPVLGWVSDVVDNPNPLRRSNVEVAGFSSRGPTLVDGLIKPDVIAPGVKVVAANTRNTSELPNNLLPGAVVQNTADGGGTPKAYVQLSGTSFAAPVVSGIAALMLQATPNLTPKQIKAIMMLTAQRVNDTNHRTPNSIIESFLAQGAGLVNGYSAVRLAQNVRSDAKQAIAGESLLKGDRTMQGLIEDLKLRLYDVNGHFQEKAVFNSGLLMSDGILLSDGLLMSDGILLSDGLLMSDGILLSDGLLMSDGILLSDGLLMSDGSLFPEGLLMSDSFIRSNLFSTSGSSKYVNENTFTNAVQMPNKQFYPDGIKKQNGNVYGRTVFSSTAHSIWGSSVFNPMSLPSGIVAESVSLLGGQDNTPISGITNIGSDSPYFPRLR